MDWVVVAFTLGLALAARLRRRRRAAMQVAGSNLNVVLRDDSRDAARRARRRAVRRGARRGASGAGLRPAHRRGAALRELPEVARRRSGLQGRARADRSTSVCRSCEYPDDGARTTFANRALARIRRLPGVEAAGVTSDLPFGGDGSSSVIFAEGYVMAPGESVVSPNQPERDPRILRSARRSAETRTALHRRRHPDAPRVVIVDERLAKKFWPNLDPIGRRMFLPATPGGSRQARLRTRTGYRSSASSANVKLQGPDRRRGRARRRLLCPVRAGPDAQHRVSRSGRAGRRSGAASRPPSSGRWPSSIRNCCSTTSSPCRTRRAIAPAASQRRCCCRWRSARVALLLASIGIYGVLALSGRAAHARNRHPDDARQRSRAASCA